MPLEELIRSDCGKKVFDKLTPEMKEEFRGLEKKGATFHAPPNTGSVPSKFMDGAFEFYISGILYGPTTQMANVFSLSANTAIRFPETAFAVATSQLAKDPTQKLKLTEMQSEFQGFLEGSGQAMDFLSLQFKNLGRQTNLETIPMMENPIPEVLVTNTKLENFHRSITAENWGLADTFILGTAVRYLGNIVNIPGSLLTTTDLLAKTINFQASVGKFAARQARIDTDIDGVIQPEAFRNRFETLKQYANADPKDPIAVAAILDADERAFTNRTHSSLSQTIVEKQFPGVRWVIPLKRSVLNAIGFALERSPLAMAQAALPGTNSPTAQMLRSGNPVERSDAVGRMAVSTVLFTTSAGLLWDYLEGEAPMNPQQKAEYLKNGHFPMAIKTPIGHLRYRLFGQAEQYLKTLGLYKQAINSIDEDTMENADQTILGLTQAFMFAMADAAVSDIWTQDVLRALKDINTVINDEDPERFEKFVAKKLGSMAVNQLAILGTRAIDPGVKANETAWDAIQSRIMFLSKSVPNRVDVWGEDITYSADQNPDYLDPALGMDPMYKAWGELGFKIPDISRSRGKVRMTPKEFHAWQVYAGKGDGSPQTSLRYRADQLMRSSGFKSYEFREGQVKDLRELFMDQRKNATELLMNDDRFDYRERVETQIELERKMLRRKY